MAKSKKGKQAKKTTSKKAVPKKSATRVVLKASDATGCCKILIPGEGPKFHSRITEFQCQQIANGIGGATYEFDSGADCPI